MTTNTHAQTVLSEQHKVKFGKAVVIGSSIAGITAARVLSDYFAHVTLVDRDSPPRPSEFRQGVPQSRHAHRLLTRGQKILEQQFPGLTDELLNLGAVPIRASQEITIDYDGNKQTARPRQGLVSLSASHALLESTIYHRLTGYPNIHFIQGYEAIGLRVDELNERATGVWLKSNRCQPAEIELSADLIVDASGRNSKTPQWLESLGYTPPEEWSVNSFVGYATRIYERPDGFDSDWKMLYVQPTPPDGTRGGTIIPIEGNRWHVTLIGVAEDYPPHDDEGFLEFAKSLPASQLYEAIKDVKPLTKSAGFRRTASRVRRFDKLPHYLEGFLVYGDAAYILNPLYAQGMTAAAIGGQILDRCLAQQPQGDLSGLPRAFQQKLSRSLSRLWHIVTSQDWHWSATTVIDNTDQIYRN